MATKIVTKNSSTASAVPTTGDLVQGELAVNVADKRLFTEDNAGAIVELGTNPTTLTVTGEITANGGIALGDNDKATFGAGDDLQIYHDGSDSFVSDVGTGDLYLQGSSNIYFRKGNGGEVFAHFADDGACKLRFDNSTKLTTTSTGIDVTGTATMGGVEVSDTDDIRIRLLNGATFKAGIQAATTAGDMIAGSAVDDLAIRAQTNMLFATGGNAERMRIDSAGRQLIGYTSSVGTTYQTNLQVKGSSASNYGGLGIVSSNNEMLGVVGTWSNGENSLMIAADPDNLRPSSSIVFTTDATERMRIDSSGNVGIGTSNIYGDLHLQGGQQDIILTNTNADGVAGATIGRFISQARGYGNNGAEFASIDFETNASAWFKGDIVFKTNNSDGTNPAIDAAERMRIDSSGNLLVGKSANDNTTVGGSIRAGESTFTAGNSRALTVGRNTNDGELIQFRKGTGSVGTIGAIGSDLYVGTGDTGLRFLPSSDAILPAQGSTGATRDNAIDIGTGTARFDDIYATNGTIQTSDRNDKQDIAELSDAEQRVAVAAKGLLRKFRWKSSVSEKGDDARTHFGIIAQDLQAAFAAEGLDAGDYAMFISTTWTDEETNEEKTRMGVRYSELLAFIISAI